MSNVTTMSQQINYRGKYSYRSCYITFERKKEARICKRNRICFPLSTSQPISDSSPSLAAKTGKERFQSKVSIAILELKSCVSSEVPNLESLAFELSVEVGVKCSSHAF